MQDVSAASRNSPGSASPSRRWTSTGRWVRSLHNFRPVKLAGDALEFVAQRGGFVGCQLNDKTTTTLEWYPHNDAAPLLGCFQRTVTGPGLHRRHRVLPPDSSWPAFADLVGAEHAPPVNFQPYPTLNCQITPPLFPIRVGTYTKTRNCCRKRLSNRFRRHPTTAYVIVDHAGRLHQRIGGRRPD